MRVRGFADATPCWAELASSDPAAAAAFYCDLFGWEAAEAGDGTTFLTLRGLASAGLAPIAAPGQQSAWITWVSTEDIHAAAAAAAGCGGRLLLPVTAVGDRGQRAVLADPEGGVLTLWQRGQFRGAQVVSEPGALSWSDLATRDVAAAAAFYYKVFGWTEQKGGLAGLEYWEWSMGNRVVAGMVPMGDQYPAEVPAHWRTTFEVADCAAAVWSSAARPWWVPSTSWPDTTPSCAIRTAPRSARSSCAPSSAWTRDPTPPPTLRRSRRNPARYAGI